MRWGTNESGGGGGETNEMGGEWVLIGGPMRWETTENRVERVTRGTNKMRDQ